MNNDDDDENGSDDKTRNDDWLTDWLMIDEDESLYKLRCVTQIYTQMTYK